MTNVYSVSSAWTLLESRGWLADRDATSRVQLRSIARILKLRAGDTLYRYGDTPNGIFGLIVGGLDISIPRADGQEFSVHRSEAGAWFGDLALFATDKRLMTVRASMSSQLIQLPTDKVLQLIAEHPALLQDFYALSYLTSTTLMQLIGNLTISPTDVRLALRLLFYDEELPDNVSWVRVSRQRLADLVAMSVPTLQRALRRLEEKGLIEVGYGRVRVIDRTGLLGVCNESELATGDSEKSS